MASQTTKLSISPREPEGSRSTRRLRRSGRVPGILYGGDAEPLTFSVDARELRHALGGRGAVLEVSDGGSATPAILKSAQYHPVRGETMHVDLLRVDLSVAMTVSSRSSSSVMPAGAMSSLSVIVSLICISDTS